MAAAALAAVSAAAYGEVWYVPGWNRTAERDGLAYASCTNVFNGAQCRFWQWDGDRSWPRSERNADEAANALAEEKVLTWIYVPLGHGEKASRLDSWEDGLRVPIDIGDPCALLNASYGELGDKPKSDDNLAAWHAFCLDKSCCWALFRRKYDGETYQMWGYRRSCMLVIEFDDKGIVKRQYPVHYGVGDG